MKTLGRAGVRSLIAREWQELVTVKASDRPWQMPFAAAVASGGPITNSRERVSRPDGRMRLRISDASLLTRC